MSQPHTCPYCHSSNTVATLREPTWQYYLCRDCRSAHGVPIEWEDGGLEATASEVEPSNDHRTAEENPAVTELELWAVNKDKRTLRCVARYLPDGIDLRLMEAEAFRRTELHKDAGLAELKAAGWRKALEERGWSAVKGRTDTM